MKLEVHSEGLTAALFQRSGYVYYPAAETGFDLAAEYPSIDAWRRRVAALAGVEAALRADAGWYFPAGTSAVAKGTGGRPWDPAP
jgi:hypothetical protein